MTAKEYIEREATQNEIKKLCDKYNLAYGEQYGGFAEKIANITNTIPAADVQEVKHGENITSMHPTDEFICSECGVVLQDVSEYIVEDDVYREFYFDYCPNCGAKMDKE